MIIILDKHFKEVGRIYDAEFISAHEEENYLRIIIAPNINIEFIGGFHHEIK